MKSKTYTLSEIKGGQFMCWTICAQAAYTYTITLKNTQGHVYATYRKSSGSQSLTLVGHGSADVITDTVLIQVDCDQAETLDQSINSFNITDAQGKSVGCGYNICVEDSNDADYNDIYINIVAWKHKG